MDDETTANSSGRSSHSSSGIGTSSPEAATPRDKLNLGCGAFKKPGYLNVDGNALVEPDVVVDLDRFPYPFADAQFELIEADHVLEHLHDPFAVVRELHRILRPGGTLRIRVPHFSRGFTHADHKRGFDVSFPYYFDPSFRGGYSGTELELVDLRLRWFAQPYLKRTVLGPVTFGIAAAAGRVLDALARISPFLCSRLWAFWVGGFEEIEFVFRRPQARARR
jgi:SAM-dependent methyltransferase